MATTRQRSRSSVDHIFDLVGDLDEDQLSNLLHELNSSGETNVPVSQGVEYFEEQRRARGPPKALRPTPSFINQPHEPVDWPKQKPRAVSGSQWRQSMRVASPPYAAIARHQTAPISPPLSPPLSPPRHDGHDGYGPESPVSPRRSVTAPVLSMDKSSVPIGRPISPPREAEDEEPGSQLASFSFNMGGSGAAAAAAAAVPATPRRQQTKEDDGQSPRQQQQQRQQQRQQQQQPNFNRISTMPLMGGSSFHPAEDTLHGLPRPRTSTGDAATTANAFKPRSFRRISRPVFLSPANIPTPDALAQRLSQYLFEDPSPPFPPASASASASASLSPSRPSGQWQRREEEDEAFSLEAMLKEPVTPRVNKMVYGRVEKEVPSVGIFEVLSEG
ncbi:hypothetical protein VSDG_04978 [Cytospora chrysosperma]|uniref:Uncharacterized protein n=1 Tax=Cytospora chrysosperma TaxID=252740 RepID=A0A423VYL3_CYTCH|nr:hypothetical protein VSDG_04978 [Valsa sordida]